VFVFAGNIGYSVYLLYLFMGWYIFTCR